MQAALEPLLVKYGVDLAFWGHHHSYQRTCPIARGNCTTREAGGVIHLVIGMAGFELTKTPIFPQPAIFEVVDMNDYGYTRITADAAALKFEFVANSKRVVKDSITLNARQ